ncbi:MAG: NADH:ubiquinone reductase (Na(+)-transporting) subunit F [Desulfatibacillaceae bacterium]
MTSFIWGLLAMSGLTASLAALLEIANMYIADYGEVHVDINDGDKEFDATGGGKLLTTLQDQGIFVPSACGGRGSCGLCKVRVKEGGGPLLPTETPYLEDEEIERNVRLSCQLKVRENIRIEIPEELFYIKEFLAKVDSLRDLTHNIREVNLKLVEPNEIKFKPGQFVQFEAPQYPGSPEPVYRAYSLASPASDTGRITLVITKVPDGICTTFVHEHLKEGDEVTINGPYGDFYLRDSDAEMIMVATGSGLAPLMSILYQMRDEDIKRKATLYFGVRTRGDLFYTEELKKLEEQLHDFTFVPVLSQPGEDTDWDGATGLVTQPINEHLKDGDNDKREAYLCGNPLMIESAVELFDNNGITEERIFYDKFA